MKKKSSKLLVGLLALSMILSGGILPFGLTHLDSYAATQQNLNNSKLKSKVVDAESGQAITENKPVNEMKNVEEKRDDAQLEALNTALDTEKDKQNPVEVSSNLTLAIDNDTVKKFNNLEVSSNTAANYGYEKPAAYKNKVTLADVFVKAHEDVFGDDFKANPKEYFDYSDQGFITKFYGKPGANTSYYVNNTFPLYPGTDKGSVVNDTVVKNDDSINFWFYQDTEKWSDYYTYLDKTSYQEDAGKDFEVTLKDVTYGNPSKPAEGIKLAIVNADGETVAEAVTNNEGKATFNISKPGDYTIKPVAGSEAHKVVVPFVETVKITGEEPGTGGTTGGAVTQGTPGTSGSGHHDATVSGNNNVRANKTSTKANTGDTTDILMYALALAGLMAVLGVVAKRKGKDA